MIFYIVYLIIQLSHFINKQFCYQCESHDVHMMFKLYARRAFLICFSLSTAVLWSSNALGFQRICKVIVRSIMWGDFPVAPLGDGGAKAGEKRAGIKFTWCLSTKSQTVYRERPRIPLFACGCKLLESKQWGSLMSTPNLNAFQVLMPMSQGRA